MRDNVQSRSLPSMNIQSRQHELSVYKIILSFNPATNMGTFATAFCTRSGLESKLKPIGIEIDMIGRTSSVLDM